MIKHACAECKVRGREIARLQVEIIGYRARNARYCNDNCCHARYAKKHKLWGGLNHICARCPLKEPVTTEEIGREDINGILDGTLLDVPADTQEKKKGT